MLVNQAYRYELKPNNKQITMLLKHAGVARFAWNWALAQRIALFETNEGKERFTDAMTQHRELNALKKTDFPWMYDVSKCAPQGALRALDVAFTNFWRGRKSGKHVGFPRFKKKGIHDSFTLAGAIHVFNDTIQLPRLGKIRTKENTGKFDGRILSATVSREANRWFVSLSVERERDIPVRTDNEAIGVDLGLNCFAVIHDGANTAYLHAPKPLAKSLKRLQRASKKHSRKQKGSNNKRKSAMRLARLHQSIRNQRKDFLHKLTTTLAKTKRVIAIEDLHVKGMVQNHCVARSIADTGWGEVRRMLGYKTLWYNSVLLVINRFAPSSRACSECGAINDSLVLSDRMWVCMECGAVHDRDENASKNIRTFGLALLDTGSSPGIYACGDSSGGRTASSWSTSHESEKQEANTSYLALSETKG